MDFDPIIEAYLEGTAPKLTPLVEFQWPSGTQRLWFGRGTLNSGGFDWLGINRIVQIEGLEQAGSIESSDLTFTLSGADSGMGAIFPIAADEDRTDYVGAIVIVPLQFMGDAFGPIAEPWALKAGICGTMELSNRETEEGRERTINLPAKNIFSGRGVPRNSNWSSRDQLLRHPGDHGLDELPLSQQFSFPQPWR